MQLLVDATWAMKRAEFFLKQYYTNVTPIEAILDEDIWLVTVLIGQINKGTRLVRIDADTGKIMSFI